MGDNIKKYQIFISSTYKDLIEEREEAVKAILLMDNIPSGMEMFSALDNEQFEVIKKVIDLCDYYVLIIGKKYGTINKKTGLSYTEMEYDYAVEKEIPVLVFAINEDIKLSESKIEKNKSSIEKLKSFRKKAMNNRLAVVWDNKTDLSEKIVISIIKSINSNPRPGWQRAKDYDEESLKSKILDLTEKCNKLEEKNNGLEKQINNLTGNQELEFENNNYLIHFNSFSGAVYSKRINLLDLFLLLSIRMIDVSINIALIMEIIEEKYFGKNYSGKVDVNDINIILLQLKELTLIDSKWIEGKGQYWYLTDNGKSIRNKHLLKKKK